MAIGYRGNATNAGSNGQNLTISLTALGGGSGAAALPGDVVVVAGMVPSPGGTPGWPAGYTSIDNGLNSGNTGRLVTAYKRMGPIPDTSVLFTGDGDANSSDGCMAYVLSGVDPTTPIGSVSFAQGSSTNPDCPSVTPTVTGAAVLAIAFSRVAETGVTNPTNFTNQAFVNATADTNDCSLACSIRTGRTSGVAEDPSAYTAWVTGAWRAISVVINPELTQSVSVLASTTPVPTAKRASSKPVLVSTTPVGALLRSLVKSLLVSTTLLASVSPVAGAVTPAARAGVWLFSGHCPAATGLQDCVSDEMLARGITPSLVEGTIGFSFMGADGSSTSHAVIGFGAYDGTSYAYASAVSRDNVATTEVWRDQGTDRFLAGLNAVDGSGSYVATVSAFIPGGVRLNWSSVGGGNLPIRFVLLLYGGADYRGKVTTKALGTGTSAITVSNIGFALQAGRLFSAGAANASGPEGFFLLNFGRFLADGTQKSASFANIDAAASDGPSAYISSDRALSNVNVGAATVGYTLTTSNVTSSGFDMTPSASAGSDDVLIVAHDFGGLSVSLFDFATATAVGDQSLTTPGFKPQFFETVGTNLASRDAAQFDVAAATGLGIGWGSRWDSGGFSRVTSAMSQTSLTATTSATINLPAGIVAGDKLYVLVTSRGHTAGTARVSVTDSSGVGSAWTLAQGGAAESTTRQASIWFKDAVAGMTGNVSITGAVNSVASMFFIVRGSGVSGDPMAGVTIQSNASGTESHAAITPAENDTLVALAVFNTAAANAVSSPDATNPALLALNGSINNTGGSGCGVALGSAMQIKSATTGALTWAQTNGTTISFAFYFSTVKVKNWATAANVGLVSPTDGNNLIFGDACLISPSNTDLTATRASLKSLDSTGVTLTYGKADGSATMCFGFALQQATVDQYALGSTTPLPSLARNVSKFVRVATTPLAAVVKAMSEALLAITTPTPTLAMSKQKSQAVLAITTPVGRLVRQIAKFVLASSTPVPSGVMSTGKLLRVTTTPIPSDAMQSGKLVRATTTPVPSLARAAVRLLLVLTTPVPSLSRVGGRAVLATTTPVGALVRQIATTIRATTTPVGALVRQIGKLVRVVTTPVPALANLKAFLLSLLASTTPVPRLVRQIAKPVLTSTTPVPSLVRQIATTLRAITTPIPSLVRQIATALRTSTTPVPSLSPVLDAGVIEQLVQAITTPLASLAKGIAEALLVSTTPVPRAMPSAFGVLKGSGSGQGASITANNVVTMDVDVEIGDLIFVVFAQQTSLTATGATDNLGNTYVAQNAGSTGSVTGRAFYSIVTVAGALTSVTVAATASSNDWGAVVGVFQGPVDTIDANPANVSDLSSPFSCPASGVLSTQPEIVCAWLVMVTSATNYAATLPNFLVRTNTQNNARAVLGHQTVNATTSVTPQFTGTNPSAANLGTATFKKLSTGSFAQSVLAITTPLASLARVGGRAVLAITTPIPALVRQIGKLVLVSTTPVPSLAKLPAKLVAAITTPVPTLVRQIGKALRVTTTPVPSLAAVAVALKSLLVSTTPIPSLVRQIAKPVLAVTTPVPRLVRQIGTSVLAITTPVPSLVRSMAKRLAATTTPLAAMIRQRGVMLRAIANAVPSLLVAALGAVRIDPKYLLQMAARVRHAFPAYVRGLAGNVTRRHENGAHTRGFNPDKRRDE